jgi:hypothetical protein
MKFVSIFKYDPSAKTGPPSDENMAKMGHLIGEMMASGALVDTGGVLPTGVSMRVRREGDRVSSIDGPFAESKEVVGGYAVFDVATKDEVLALTRRFLDIAGDGVCELIEVTSAP